MITIELDVDVINVDDKMKYFTLSTTTTTTTTKCQAIPTGRHPGCGAGAVPTKPSAGQRLGTVINQVKYKEEDHH